MDIGLMFQLNDIAVKSTFSRNHQTFANVYISEAAPPMHSRQNSDNFRPVSSVYSQPSPGPMHDQFPYNTYAKPMTPNSAEVSPPSSPEFDGTRR